MSDFETTTATPTDYDPARGEAGWVAIEPKARALPVDQIQRMSVNLYDGGLRAIHLGRFATSEPVAARIARLPADELDAQAFEILEPCGWAALHVSMQAEVAAVAESRATVPGALAAEGLEQVLRMRALADYYFADDPVLGPELASIRKGSGHKDLALDLVRYAAIYDAHHALVSRDPKHYRPGDASNARRLADAINEALAASQGPTAREWIEQKARVFTLLRNAYDEVHATLSWLFRRDPAAQRQLIHLHGPAPKAASKPKPAEATPPAAPAPTDAPA